MKWPSELVIIRHGESAYNELKRRKAHDPDYQEFVRRYKEAWDSPSTRIMADRVREKFVLRVSDYGTPLTEEGRRQACVTGMRTRETFERAPDIIFYSPYVRTRETLEVMMKEWGKLKDARLMEDDRIREQEHGLALLYNDWRLFHHYNPEQKRLYDLLGPYWYQYPQGESISQVRDRIRSFLGTLVREFPKKNVWLITHHLTILSIRANLERLTPEQFMQLNDFEKPVNCGVTKYEGRPAQGENGQLELVCYNKTLFPS